MFEFEARKEIEDFLDSKKHRVAMVLGSGWSTILEELNVKKRIPYSAVEEFPESTVPGHDGELVIAEHGDTALVIFAGRFHFYEGYTAAQVVLQIDLVKSLAIDKLVLTNAAGCLIPEWEVGNIMLIEDHINMLGENPMDGGPNFIDMSGIYSKSWSKAVSDSNSSLRKGVYLALRGPTYETPAEVRMCRILGAHAVGMSTVPEAIRAKYHGITTLGLSALSNMAAGILDQELEHGEIKDVIGANSNNYRKVLFSVIEAAASI